MRRVFFSPSSRRVYGVSALISGGILAGILVHRHAPAMIESYLALLGVLAALCYSACHIVTNIERIRREQAEKRHAAVSAWQDLQEFIGSLHQSSAD